MSEWHKNIQEIINVIDDCIKNEKDEAFTHTFKEIYGVSPSEFRANPRSVVLRTIIKPFDCYLMEGAMNDMNQKQSNGEVKTYFVQIPAHKFLHIRNSESVGYWDFWQKQGDIPLAEAYGVRLPVDYDGPVPEQMTLMDVPEGEYIVFEHGPFDFETESASVEAKIEKAMKEFDYEGIGYSLDLSQGRVFYFYHDCERFFKYVRPVCRK